MTDLDGELEKLRAEARQRLEGERELEEKLAGYEKTERELRAPAAPVERAEHDHEDEDEEKHEKASASTSVSAVAAEESARKAVKTVSALSTEKLLVLLVALVFGTWIVSRIMVPLAALGVLAIVVLLGWRFLRWMTSEREDDDVD